MPERLASSRQRRVRDSMILLWILLTMGKPMVTTGQRTVCPGYVTTHWRGMASRYLSLNLVALTYTCLTANASHFFTTKTVLLQKDLTTGVDVTTLHPLLTNLGQELQPSLRNLVCSYQTTLQLKDALHVDWQHLRSPLHKSVRFAN